MDDYMPLLVLSKDYMLYRVCCLKISRLYSGRAFRYNANKNVDI